ncbi:CRIB domain-containing protein RIC6 [Sesamum alatum]|uniref:CRIB domain-containing protein RIC6 n=1 Tax=Sesamum alatum TaxID=300844 RepID=A0AAE1XUY3_9LAMI|nr:CRIB domain-containing protein RIC6 [Sesamum alatum]
MSTKVKGLFKGLRYISQIFEEDKDQEMQIGLPTDVKHVAHIGWDGPSVDAPSWMKEFKSAPLELNGETRDDPDIKWVSEDRKSNRTTDSPGGDAPDQPAPRPSRRHHSADSSPGGSPKKKDPSTKSRQPKRNQSTATEGSTKAIRQLQESSQGSDSPSRPDIPKKTRRKKSKETVNAGGSTRSRSKANSKDSASNGTCSSAGPDNEQTSDPVPNVNDKEKERRVFSED